MRYMLLIHLGNSPTPRDPDAWNALPEDVKQGVYADYMAINQTPGVTPGTELAEPAMATTVRIQDGQTLVTDGPVPETKEALGGYLFFEADSMEDAVALAARIPAARLGGAVEIRPLVER